MKSASLHAAFLLASAFAILLPAAARADESAATFAFSDPSKPGTLKIHIGHGDIRVAEADARQITVVSDCSAPRSAPREDGLRVLSASSSYAFSEKDNVASLEYAAGGRGEFRITVPRGTAVIVSNLWGGDVACSGLSGNIDIKCMSGDVHLDDIAGGAVVEAMKGEIRAQFRELHADRPVCFTSLNGEISIRVPATAKADIRFRTQNGSILTDFDDKALVSKSEVAPGRGRAANADAGSDDRDAGARARATIREASRQAARAAREVSKAVQEAARAAREGAEEADEEAIPPLPPLPPLPAATGGKLVSGALNGGGTLIQATTLNGDVILRKANAKE